MICEDTRDTLGRNSRRISILPLRINRVRRKSYSYQTICAETVCQYRRSYWPVNSVHNQHENPLPKSMYLEGQLG